MAKQSYEAVGRDCGVIIWRCGHAHRTPLAAYRCGNSRLGPPGCPAGTVSMAWIYGGVVDQDDRKVLGYGEGQQMLLMEESR